MSVHERDLFKAIVLSGAAIVTATSGCGTATGPDAAMVTADAGTDAPTPAGDAGNDAAVLVADAGTDAGSPDDADVDAYMVIIL